MRFDIGSIKKRFKHTVLCNTYTSLRKSKQNLLYMLLFDVLFVITLVLYNKLTVILFPQLFTLNAVTTSNVFKIFFSALFAISLNFLLVVLIYSFFKYHVIKIVKQHIDVFNKKRERKTAEQGIFRFYLLNLFLFVPFFIASLILLLIFSLIVRTEYISKFAMFVLLIIFLLAYATYSFAHAFFINGFGLKSFRKSFKLLFHHHNYYFPVLGFSIAVFFAVFAILYILVWLLADVIGLSVLQQNSLILIIFSIILIITSYKLLFFNRFYFYNILLKKGMLKK